MKYSPVLGESVAEEIIGEKKVSKMFDYSSLKLIDLKKTTCKKFWNLVNGEEKYPPPSR